MFSTNPVLAEYQRSLLEHLTLVCRTLEEHGVWHSLSSGTLLGAVRESGFIQWDDDIDLMIRLEDRDRVLKVLKGTADITTRVVNSAYLKTWDLRYTVLFKNGAKGHPSMDLFCMGPADLREMPYLQWQFKRIISFAALGQAHASWEIPTVAAPYERFRRVFLTKVDFVARHNKYVELALVNNSSSEIYSDLANFSWARREWFEPESWSVERIRFEGRWFSVLANYDQLLVNQYGSDWRQPEKSRSLTRTHVVDRMISVTKEINNG